jgi:predicted nucleic acid-binding Zn ribbon protein
MSDEPLEVCEEHGTPVRRVFHPIAVHFKGSGFYNTDYGKKGKSAAGSDGKAESSSSDSSKKSDSDSSSSTSKDSGSKPASKPASSD